VLIIEAYSKTQNQFRAVPYGVTSDDWNSIFDLSTAGFGWWIICGFWASWAPEHFKESASERPSQYDPPRLEIGGEIVRQLVPRNDFGANRDSGGKPQS
jgi:hypothetical protein